MVAEVRSASDADFLKLTLAVHGIDALVSAPSVFPSVDFVQGLTVSVRASDEEAARGIVRSLSLATDGPGEPPDD